MFSAKSQDTAGVVHSSFVKHYVADSLVSDKATSTTFYFIQGTETSNISASIKTAGKAEYKFVVTTFGGIQTAADSSLVAYIFIGEYTLNGGTIQGALSRVYNREGKLVAISIHLGVKNTFYFQLDKDAENKKG